MRRIQDARGLTAIVGAGVGALVMGTVYVLLGILPGGGVGGGDIRLAPVIGALLGFLGTAELIVGDEDVRDAAVLGGLDGGVGVVERDPEEPRQFGTDRRLPAAGRADEDDLGHQASQVRMAIGIASR